MDIFVAHSPAFGLGDIPNSKVHSGFPAFLKLLDTWQPKLFVFGHAHLNYGVNRIMKYKNTWLVNAYDHFFMDLNNLESLSTYIPQKIFPG